MHIKDLLGVEQVKDFLLGSNDIMKFRDMIRVSREDELKRLILIKAHNNKFTFCIHTRIKKNFCWSELKRVLV